MQRVAQFASYWEFSQHRDTGQAAQEAATAPDEETHDLLTLLAMDERHERDYDRFLAACRADADAHAGQVSVNRVRSLLSNQYGLDVEPRRYSSYWQRATKAAVLVNTGEWETCTDTRGRNVGKP